MAESNNPADKFKAKVKKKKDKEKALEARQAERDKASGKYNVSGESVSKKEFEQEKKVGGTSQRSTKEKGLEAQKIEAKNSGLIGSGEILTPEVRQALQQQAAAQEEKNILAENLTSQSIQQLEEEIANPPSLRPKTIGEDISDRTGLTQDELAKRSLAVAGAGVVSGVAGPLALGSTVANTAAVGTSISTSASFTSGLLTAVGAYLVAGGGLSPTDIGRGRIETQSKIISEMSSQAMQSIENVQAAGGNVQVYTQETQNLRNMHQQLLEAEEAIKLYGIYNAKFRTSEEYLAIQQESTDTRKELRTAFREIDNLIRTGETSSPKENF